MSEESFQARILRGGEDDCWPWQGAAVPKGYGRLRWGDGYEYAHRVAYLLEYGAIPAGLFVCHRCDNPGCCNPRHLFVGDAHENNMDGVRKGRYAIRLSWPKVRRIRRLLAKGYNSTELGRMFYVCNSTIHDVWTRKIWKDGSKPEKRPKRFRHKGKRIPRRVVREIRELYGPGGKHQRERGKLGAAELAARYGISPAMVEVIVRSVPKSIAPRP